MAPFSQDYSFSSSAGHDISNSQFAQNSTSNPVEGVRSMTIRQLLRAKNNDDDSDTFTVDGHSFKKILLIANANESGMHGSTAKILYVLDDGTGRIKGNRWPLEKGEPTIGPFAYTRILGELESFRGFKSVKILNIRPVYDGNEVFHHYLSAMIDTVVCERGLPPPQHQPKSQHIPDKLDDLSQQLQRTSLSNSTPTHASQAQTIQSTSSGLNAPGRTSTSDTVPARSTSAPEKYLRLTRVQRVFLQCLSNQEAETSEENGVHFSDFFPAIIAMIPDLDAEGMSAAIEGLIDAGFVTAAADDEHFRRKYDT